MVASGLPLGAASGVLAGCAKSCKPAIAGNDCLRLSCRLFSVMGCKLSLVCRLISSKGWRAAPGETAAVDAWRTSTLANDMALGMYSLTLATKPLAVWWESLGLNSMVNAPSADCERSVWAGPRCLSAGEVSSQSLRPFVPMPSYTMNLARTPTSVRGEYMRSNLEKSI